MNFIANLIFKAPALTLAVSLLALPVEAQTPALGGAKPAAPQGAPPAGNRNLAVVPAAAMATPHQRVALVIGNGSYKDAPLANPVNDARAMAKALQDSGFTVIARENTDQRTMLVALREFGDKLRGGGVGLFYYAGHGMQIKGRNFLIPVGAAIDREDEVAYSAVDAQAVLDKMEAAGNGANIMILDACRNNPFVRSTRSGQAGLAQMDAPVGTLVAFATSPGAVASDGNATNGLYTQHLLTAMRQSGAKVEDVFKQVRANVRRDSQGKQVPWEATSMEGDFYFTPGSATGALASGDPSSAVEEALWEAVKNSQLPVELRAYLARYPKGRYAQAAEQRLAFLSGVAMAGTVIAAAQGVPGAQGTQGAPAVRPSRVSNSFGYTTGDRWRYQVVDKFKSEVVSNYSLQVDKIEASGDVVLNKGDVVWFPSGSAKYSRSPGRERFYSDGFHQYPDNLKIGAKLDVSYEIDVKYAGGAKGKEITKGTMVVKAQERVKTPAGEFDAWRVERDLYWQSPSTDSRGAFKMVAWYVPSLRRYVAWDEESRNANGSFNRRERHELTSYSIQGADSLALR